MTKQELIHYLSNPKNLDGLSSDELDLLIVEQPYVEIFHYLRAKKETLQKNPDTSVFNKTALYSSNRKKLYFYLNEKDLTLKKKGGKKKKKKKEREITFNSDENDSSEENKEIIEVLIPVDSNQKISQPEKKALLTIPEILIKKKKKKIVGALDEIVFKTEFLDKEPENLLKPSLKKETKKKLLNNKEIETKSDKVELSSNVEELTEVFPSEEITIKPVETNKEPVVDMHAKSSSQIKKGSSRNEPLKKKKGVIANGLSDNVPASFTEWLEELNNKKAKKKKKEKEKIEKKIHTYTSDSTKINEYIASEPLAYLLAQQGHKKKAIKMYSRLSLIFPEKSTYFASQIENLNRK